jgi:hypothetical protein
MRLLFPIVAALFACRGGGEGAPEAGEHTGEATPEDSAPQGGDSAPGGESADSEAAPGGDTAPDAVDTSPQGDPVFESLVSSTDPVTGDMSCFRPGSDCWSMRADESCVGSLALAGLAADAAGAPLAGAQIDIFWSDELEEEPDQTLLAGEDGAVGGELPSCVALTWRVTAGGGEAVWAHRILPAPADGGALTPTFTGYSAEDLAALAAAAGFEAGEGLGMVAGRIIDCAGEPLSRAQVIISLVGGGYPDTQIPRYYSDGALDPARLYTDDSGRFLIGGVPEGRHSLEIWGGIEGYEVPMWLSTSEVDAVEGGLTELELQVEIAGAIYPEGCLSVCE